MVAALVGKLYKLSYSLRHNPSIGDNNDYTVAMYLAESGEKIPKEWEHKASRQNNYGETVAMVAA